MHPNCTLAQVAVVLAVPVLLVLAVRRMECLSLLVRAAEAAAEVEVPVLVLVLAPTTIT